MRREHSAYLGFDPLTLHAEIPVSYQSFESSTNCLSSDLLFIPNNLREKDPVNSAILQAKVEHEFFHARHFFSSTFCWVTYYLNWIYVNHKKMFINSIDYGGFIRDTDGFRNLAAHKKDWRAAYSMSALTYLEPLIEILSNPDRDQDCVDLFDIGLDAMKIWNRDADRSTKTRSILIPGFEFCEPFHLLPNAVISDDFECLKSILSPAALMEGIATWREYMYFSQMVLQTRRREFSDATANWINSVKGQRYRAAADQIYLACGANMSCMLPGVLIDIALNPPISSASIAFADFHPSSRFKKIIEVIGDISPALAKIDNTELVDDNFYNEVESFICKRLGWSRVLDNTQNLAKRLQDSIKTMYKSDLFNPLSPIICGHRFIRALESRQNSISTFIFPWTSSEKDALGYDIRPIFIEWLDEIHVSETVPGEALLLWEELFSAIPKLALNNAFSRYRHSNRDIGHLDRLYTKATRQCKKDRPDHIYKFIATGLGVDEKDFERTIIKRSILNPDQ